MGTGLEQRVHKECGWKRGERRRRKDVGVQVATSTLDNSGLLMEVVREPMVQNQNVDGELGKE